jgi:hypothetical protein
MAQTETTEGGGGEEERRGDVSTAAASDLQTLLAANAAQIDSLLASVHLSIPYPSQYDEVWAPRFVMGRSDAEALEAAKNNIVWRTEKAEMLAAAGRGERLPRFARIERYVAAGYHPVTPQTLLHSVSYS